MNKNQTTKNADSATAEPRCNKSGDMPDGRHVTEFENDDLNLAELRFKASALLEAHEDTDEINAEIVKRINALPKRKRGSDYTASLQRQQAEGK